MPELYKKTFSDEKKRSDHSRKKENGGKKEKFSSWAIKKKNSKIRLLKVKVE